MAQKLTINRLSKLGNFENQQKAFWGFVHLFKMKNETMKFIYKHDSKEYWIVFRAKSGFKRGYRLELRPCENMIFKYKIHKAYTNMDEVYEDDFYNFMGVKRKLPLWRKGASPKKIFEAS